MLHPSRFQSLVGDVCVKAIFPWLYELARCCLCLRWKRRISHAKSDLSSKENTFRLAFKLYKLPEPYSCPERLRQHLCL